MYSNILRKTPTMFIRVFSEYTARVGVWNIRIQKGWHMLEERKGTGRLEMGNIDPSRYPYCWIHPFSPPPCS